MIEFIGKKKADARQINDILNLFKNFQNLLLNKRSKKPVGHTYKLRGARMTNSVQSLNNYDG